MEFLLIYLIVIISVPVVLIILSIYTTANDSSLTSVDSGEPNNVDTPSLIEPVFLELLDLPYLEVAVLVFVLVIMGLAPRLLLRMSLVDFLLIVIGKDRDSLRNKFVKKNEWLNHVLKLETELNKHFKDSFPNLKSTLSEFKNAYNSYDCTTLQSLYDIKYYNSVKLMSSIMVNTDSIINATKYLNELEDSIKLSIEHDELNNSNIDELDAELELYKDLNKLQQDKAEGLLFEVKR